MLIFLFNKIFFFLLYPFSKIYFLSPLSLLVWVYLSLRREFRRASGRRNGGVVAVFSLRRWSVKTPSRLYLCFSGGEVSGTSAIWVGRRRANHCHSQSMILWRRDPLQKPPRLTNRRSPSLSIAIWDCWFSVLQVESPESRDPSRVFFSCSSGYPSRSLLRCRWQ